MLCNQEKFRYSVLATSLSAREPTSRRLGFYADQGLIPVSRSNSGHRVFARAVIRRVSFILIAQNLGYSLKQVRQALDSLPDKRTPTKADWARLSNAFSKKIEQQIESLRTLQSKLDGCIGLRMFVVTKLSSLQP